MDAGVFLNFVTKHSGDGLLSVFNTRKKKLEAISDQQDEEMLSVALMKVSKLILNILMKVGKLILKIVLYYFLFYHQVKKARIALCIKGL